MDQGGAQAWVRSGGARFTEVSSAPESVPIARQPAANPKGSDRRLWRQTFCVPLTIGPVAVLLSRALHGPLVLGLACGGSRGTARPARCGVKRALRRTRTGLADAFLAEAAVGFGGVAVNAGAGHRPIPLRRGRGPRLSGFKSSGWSHRSVMSVVSSVSRHHRQTSGCPCEVFPMYRTGRAGLHGRN